MLFSFIIKISQSLCRNVNAVHSPTSVQKVRECIFVVVDVCCYTSKLNERKEEKKKKNINKRVWLTWVKDIATWNYSVCYWTNKLHSKYNTNGDNNEKKSSNKIKCSSKFNVHQRHDNDIEIISSQNKLFMANYRVING